MVAEPRRADARGPVSPWPLNETKLYRSDEAKGAAEKLPPHVTSAQLCWLLRLTRGRVAQLSAEGGPIKRLGRDLYAIESIPNFIARQRERGDRSTEWNQARTELAQERARAARLQRLEREGKLLEVEVVQLIVAAIFRAVRDNFLGLGTRLAPQAHGAPSVPATQQIIVETESHLIR